jgi:ABC-type amino acid transport system permease subunit
VSYAGLDDLIAAGSSIKGITYQILPVWLVIGVIYLVWITGFSKLMDVVYEKKKLPGVELLMQ